MYNFSLSRNPGAFSFDHSFAISFLLEGAGVEVVLLPSLKSFNKGISKLFFFTSLCWKAFVFPF